MVEGSIKVTKINRVLRIMTENITHTSIYIEVFEDKRRENDLV